MSDTPQIREGSSLILECVPRDIAFLESYRLNAWEQRIIDPDRPGHIRGVPERQYFLRGLKEELIEPTDLDRVEPGYNRMGTLLRIDHPDNVIMPGEITPTSIERHIKEFGDISWYLSNLLTSFGMTYSKVIPAGIAGIALDQVSQTRCEEADVIMMERTLPWISLFGYSAELEAAATECVSFPGRDGRARAESRLLVAAGKFILSMSHILDNRFSTSLESVLDGNRRKLEKRMREGTVFDKSGGDDR